MRPFLECVERLSNNVFGRESTSVTYFYKVFFFFQLQYDNVIQCLIISHWPASVRRFIHACLKFNHKLLKRRVENW
jgi:hypothetical protein